jgi:type IV secretory pathway component VirB8
MASIKQNENNETQITFASFQEQLNRLENSLKAKYIYITLAFYSMNSLNSKSLSKNPKFTEGVYREREWGRGRGREIG